MEGTIQAQLAEKQALLARLSEQYQQLMAQAKQTETNIHRVQGAVVTLQELLAGNSGKPETTE